MASKSKTIEYQGTAKFNLWIKYFTDKTNKETWCNATKSALKTYNTKNYFSAGVIGHENLKKLKNLSAIRADLEGFGIGEQIKIAITKAQQGTYDDWHKLLTQIGTFTDKPNVLTHNNFNFNSLGEEISKSRKARGLTY